MSAAMRLLTLTNNDTTFDDMRAQMFENMRAGLPPCDFLDKYIEAMNAAIGEVFTADTFLPVVEAAINKKFSSEEIEAMIVFFESPVGRKWLKEFPMVCADMQVDVQALIAERMPMAIEIADRLMDQQPEPSGVVLEEPDYREDHMGRTF